MKETAHIFVPSYTLATDEFMLSSYIFVKFKSVIIEVFE